MEQRTSDSLFSPLQFFISHQIQLLNWREDRWCWNIAFKGLIEIVFALVYKIFRIFDFTQLRIVIENIFYLKSSME
jgi:hypothetical protein